VIDFERSLIKMAIVSEYYHCALCDEVKVVNRDDQVQKFVVYCDSSLCQNLPAQPIMKEIPYHVYQSICKRIRQSKYSNYGQLYGKVYQAQTGRRPPTASVYSGWQRATPSNPTGGGYQQVSTSNTTKCRVWYDNDLAAYRCSTPYSKEFVEFIKIAIPVSDRAYDPTTKIWAFAEKYLDVIVDTARKVWKNPGEVVVITKQQTQAASASPAVTKQTPEQIMVEFVKLLPNDALIAAYRRAAVELHPDRGGSMEKMSLLNMYWDRIKQDKAIK